MLAIFIIAGVVAAISLYDYFTTRSWQAVTSQVRNDAVFEKRNREYGAYRIRRDYNRNFILILLGMVGGVGAIYGAVITFREGPQKHAYVPPVTTDTTVFKLEPKMDEPKIEEPKIEQPTSPPMQEMVKFTEVRATDIRQEAIDPPVVDPTKLAGNQTQAGTDPFAPSTVIGDPKLPLGDGSQPQIPTGPVTSAQLTELAHYDGGEPERQKFMLANFNYPEIAIQSGIEGKSYLRFVIRKNGDVDEVVVVKKLKGCPECDAEAVRVVRRMPRWIPGKINGKPVDSYFNLPVTFQLK
jgi:periplasmic protein TonB